MHTELLRSLWNDLERLEEDLHHYDRGKTGFLPRNTLYTVLRAARIPVDVELLNSMLDQYVYILMTIYILLNHNITESKTKHLSKSIIPIVLFFYGK